MFLAAAITPANEAQRLQGRAARRDREGTVTRQRRETAASPEWSRASRAGFSISGLMHHERNEGRLHQPRVRKRPRDDMPSPPASAQSRPTAASRTGVPQRREQGYHHREQQQPRPEKGTTTTASQNEGRRGYATATAAPVVRQTRGYKVAEPLAPSTQRRKASPPPSVTPATDSAPLIVDYRDANHHLQQRHPNKRFRHEPWHGGEGRRSSSSERRHPQHHDTSRRRPYDAHRSQQQRHFSRRDRGRRPQHHPVRRDHRHQHRSDRDWRSDGSRRGPGHNRENRHEGTTKRHEQEGHPGPPRPPTGPKIGPAATRKSEPAPAPAPAPRSEIKSHSTSQTAKPEATKPVAANQRGYDVVKPSSAGLSVTSLLSKWGSSSVKKASRPSTAEAARRRASNESASSSTTTTAPHTPATPATTPLIESRTPAPPARAKKLPDAPSSDAPGELPPPPPPPGHKKHRRPRPQPAAIPNSVRVQPQPHLPMPKAVPQVSSPDHTAADLVHPASRFSSSLGVPPYPVSVTSASSPEDPESDFALYTEPHLSPVATREIEPPPVSTEGPSPEDLPKQEDTSPKDLTTESKENESSSDSSSSDDSDTDEEEVMQWASKMFGINRIEEEQHHESSNEELESGEGEQHGIYDLYYDDSTNNHEWEDPQAEPAATEPAATEPEFLDYYEADDDEFAERKRIRKKKKAKKLKKEKRLREKRLLEQQQQQQQQQQIEPEDDGYIYGETGRGDVVDPEEEARRRRKKKKKLKKLLQQQYILAGPTEEDFERERQYKEEVRRKRETAKPLTAAQVRAILADDAGEHGQTNWVRRSSRQPSRSILNSKQLQYFLGKLRSNHPDMKVLKMKKYINDPNAPQSLLDAALEALEENTNCESLYIQNFNEGMRDKQVRHLIKILQQPSCNIWCLNIGETYNVRTKTWRAFTRGLKKTKITHMYASEHTITSEMKDEIRDTIRNNRQKHDRHINPDNLDVIIQCTHCWWNPINAKALRPYVRTRGYGHILDDAEAQGMRGSTSAAPTK